MTIICTDHVVDRPTAEGRTERALHRPIAGVVAELGAAADHRVV